MYYRESNRLTKSHSARVREIEVIDRVIAHAYTPDNRGFIEAYHVANVAGISEADARMTLALFVSTLHEYLPVECCDELQDPLNERCLNCGIDLSVGAKHISSRYRIIDQPQLLPDLDVISASTCDVMISYRHGETDRLATDIYYHLTKIGLKVFYDKPGISGGVDWEKVFLRAASRAKHIILLLSPLYFESAYCKKEIAHSARTGGKILKVNCNGPLVDSELSWLGTVNPVRFTGNPGFLDLNLADEIVLEVQKSSTGPNFSHRVNGCAYLLSHMSRGELDSLCGRVECLRDLNPNMDRRSVVSSIIREVNDNWSKSQQLSDSLAP
ncbi:MAG: toll/interleukin-1 receptor domain-containing protein [Proteobacteria bacterium]|nr:MAG: toll/interleukin-1 receptor domain-containing protein [Pseudomonadota bacterium]